MTQIKAGRYALHMLKFSPKVRLGMLLKKHVLINLGNIQISYDVFFEQF